MNDEEKKARLREQRRAWNHEKRLEIQARYRAKNKEKLREKSLEYAKKNRGKYSAANLRRAKEYFAKVKSDPVLMAHYRTIRAARYKKNRVDICKKHNDRRRANLEERRAKERAYRAANPDIIRPITAAVRAKRRAAKSGSVVTATRSDLEKLRIKQKTCYYCGAGGKLTFDHVKPLSKGGAHSPDNLVMACQPCNRSKSDRDPITFAQSRGLLLV